MDCLGRAVATFAFSGDVEDEMSDIVERLHCFAACDGGDLADVVEAANEIFRLREQVAKPDCRTCASYGPFYGRCNLVRPRCTNGDCYEPLPPVRLWRTT